MLVQSLMLAALGATTIPTGQFIAFCYHDVPLQQVRDSPTAVDLRTFVQHIEAMRNDGANFISIDDLIRAKEGQKPLPPKAVLLTFDDTCQSFYDNVLPILEAYQIKAVVFAVTSWAEERPEIQDCTGGKTMSWSELKTVSQSGLVEIESHSHDLHKAVTIHPSGSTAAAVYRRFDPQTNRYETDAEQSARLAADLLMSAKVLRSKLGVEPRALAWPFGEYNELALQAAHAAGFRVLFNISPDQNEGLGDLQHFDAQPRWMLEGNPNVATFFRSYWAGGPVPHPQATGSTRIVHADLDMLHNADAKKERENVDRFIERMVAIKPNAVYLQAFSDLSGTGNVSEVYFPNRVLPMKADLFGAVSRALTARRIRVYAWMPTLSISLPTSEETDRLRVRFLRDGKTPLAETAYQRLSPFSDEARNKMVMLFEDLAKTGPINGVLFQDDGYLGPDEDFHAAAKAAFAAIVPQPVANIGELTDRQVHAWTTLKSHQLIAWTEALAVAVRRYQPDAVFARTLYAKVLLGATTDARFAQDYKESLQTYEQVVVMAYPLMEGAAYPLDWLRGLVGIARSSPLGIDKTVFKIQTVDWRRGECISPEIVREWIRTLVHAGAKHIAYYPDNVYADCPQLSAVRDLMTSDTVSRVSSYQPD